MVNSGQISLKKTMGDLLLTYFQKQMKQQVRQIGPNKGLYYVNSQHL